MLTLVVSGGAVERTFEVPGYATVRVVAEGGAAEIKVTTGTDGEIFAAVRGEGVCTSRCELVEFVPTGAYFGYGWYVAEPGDFTVCVDGHHNAVRYAGFDLAGGRSLVFASSFTPMSLYHRTARKVVGYECHGPSTFAFYPGRDGAFACAIRARAFFDALGGGAPGVAAKSDKFCVDTWNGALAEHGELIRRAADEYGLRDDLFLLVHCWQRYGFDRHLPEVWPPHPAFGTAEDAKATLEIAKTRGWLYGPHLNVIDIYSNSNWFAWNKVCHDAKGQPIKAWINPYSLEQSFRLLHGLASDSIRYQFGQMEAAGFAPSTAFVDVTGGAQRLTDTTWDADGRVHPMADNVAANARMFDTLRESVARTYGNAAFVSSEAPSDYLAGHLDGGDCQWMCLGHSIDRVYCWTCVGGKGLITKVPWFPLVHHDRLILHGVGYSARFEGGRGELCHGIDSDDYISCEMMLGNEPMADCYNRDARDAEARIFRPLDMDRCLRQVVRKYWLEQPVSKELAMARVKSAGFVDGNPEHVFVEWSTGLTVKVNRGERDWTVDGHVLPQYGYRAWNPKTGTESKIYRHACGRVVEESAYCDGAKTVRYASARGLPVPNFTPVEPRTVAVREGARVKVTTDWRALAGERAPSGPSSPTGLPTPSSRNRTRGRSCAAWPRSFRRSRGGPRRRSTSRTTSGDASRCSSLCRQSGPTSRSRPSVCICSGLRRSTAGSRRVSSERTARTSPTTVPTGRSGTGCLRRRLPSISDGRRRSTACASSSNRARSGKRSTCRDGRRRRRMRRRAWTFTSMRVKITHASSRTGTGGCRFSRADRSSGRRRIRSGT